MSRLLDAAGDSAFVFVVGKGGVGKTTAAGALALEMADRTQTTLLISTDPAHSLGDLFHERIGSDPAVSACSERLIIEEFAAGAAARRWLEHALGPVSEIVERGTYLEADDVGAFSRLALPGVDEFMAVLRLVELVDEAHRVVVDTAPTGHTLRLLDAAATHEGIARSLRAMADKAAAVAGALTGQAVRMSGEQIIEELEAAVVTYRQRVLGAAAFVVITRPGEVVAAETARLVSQLEQRELRICAILSTGGDTPALAAAPDALRLQVPLLEDASGCEGLRAWRGQVGPSRTRTAGPGPAHDRIGRNRRPGPGPGRWLQQTAPRLLLFAGKGGVGKTTCAAAAAVTLAEQRPVLLCSTDPAGSLDDVLATRSAALPAGLRLTQIDPPARLRALQDVYRDEVPAALESLGLAGSASLDRRVIETLWDLAPPGMDEMAAIAALLESARSGETTVIDAAPTGHFVRLLEMPETALGWTRQLMRMIVKYGLAGVAEGAAQSLLDLTRELKSLQESLRDPAAAAVFVVTLAEPMVRAETDRLVAMLAAAQIRVGAVVLNRAGPGVRADSDGGVGAKVIAPEVRPAPVGADALRRFVDTWNIVT